mmetsp:Transcript_10430/g.28398  ORF Transcript_10430/g.28398 Transcript_10430/m.28398 type:complete len:292 (+) Transcript_10430:1601-2476(+)
MVVEGVEVGERGPEQVARRGVHDTLGLTRGAGGVEEEERVLRLAGHRGAHWSLLLHLLIQPHVAPKDHGHGVARALVHEYVGHARAVRVVERVVHCLLERYHLAAAQAVVCSHDHLAARVHNARVEGFRREACKHDRVHSADACAGKHGVGRLGYHGHVDSHAIALAHAAREQHVGDAARLLQHLAVCDLLHVCGLVALPDDGHAVRGVAVEAVGGHVELATGEPRHVSHLKAALHDFGERLHPREAILCFLGKEGVRLRDGPVVHLLVRRHAVHVGILRAVGGDGHGFVG